MIMFKAFSEIEFPQVLIDRKFTDESWKNDESPCAWLKLTTDDNPILIVWVVSNTQFNVCLRTIDEEFLDLASFESERELSTFVDAIINQYRN